MNAAEPQKLTRYSQMFLVDMYSLHQKKHGLCFIVMMPKGSIETVLSVSEE